MEKWKLWLDDVRYSPRNDYEVARTSLRAINLVKEHGCAPSFMSLDHDLGGDDTAMIFVDWLFNAMESGEIPPSVFDYAVHSLNPVGRKRLLDRLGDWHRHLLTKEIKDAEDYAYYRHTRAN